MLLVFCTTIFANENYELKLYEKILPLIFVNKPILVYADAQMKSVLKNSTVFEITNECNYATLLMGKNLNNIEFPCNNKPIFSTSYRGFKNIPNSFGAFYWRKGRPQIKFDSKRIQKLHLKLPNSLKKYEK